MSSGTNQERIQQNNTKLGILKTKVDTLPEYIDTSDANATANDILRNKTAYVNGQKITGTVSNNGRLNYTPTTSQQTIPVGYTSGGTVGAVTSSIDSNIQAENIKKDVEILGVTGTYESSGDVKLFETIQEMQADPAMQEGDLAIVYRDGEQGITQETRFSSCKCPQTVVLPTAFTGNIRVNFIGSGLFEVNLTNSTFRLYEAYSGDNKVRYTSEDGITYTRVEGGDEITFGGDTIQWTDSYMGTWDDTVSYFMVDGGKIFEGLYQAEMSSIITTHSADADSQFDKVLFPNTVTLSEAYTGSSIRIDYLRGDPTFYLIISMTLTPFEFSVIDTVVYPTKTIVHYSSNDGINYIRDDGGDEIVDFISVMSRLSSSVWNDNFGYFLQIVDSVVEQLQYQLAPTQLNATASDVYKKIFYGANGVETGTLIPGGYSL